MRLTVPGGSVAAPTAILAVNGFATQFGFYKNALLSFVSHASLTRPLTPEERTALGGSDDWYAANGRICEDEDRVNLGVL